MAKNKRLIVSILCIVLVLAFVLTLVLSVVGSARAVSQSDIDALKDQQTQINNQRADIQSKIDELGAQVSSVMEQKEALDEKNELARQEIEIIDEQIALYDGLIEKKAQELVEAQKQEDEQKAALRVRMRAMEESGSMSYIAILFNATDFSDLLARMDYVSNVMEKDKKVEEDYRQARVNVENVKAEYEATQEEQVEKKSEAEEKKAQLETEISLAAQTIVELENNIEEYKAEYEANAAQENAIQAQINAAAAALEKQQQQTIASGGTVVTGSGSMIWPCSVRTVSSSYGYRVHPIFGDKRFHSGIDIAASYGDTVWAADSGTVIIATYSSSYGNYVSISHSNGTTTLYAHMSSLAVSAGQTVTQGQTIGYVGSTGWSTGAHLHFEVKVNGSTVDPTGYVR